MDLPVVVRTIADGRAVRPVWRNQAGGMTVAVGGLGYVKWSPPGGPDLHAEAARLRWAGSFVTAPRVLAVGPDDPAPSDGGGDSRPPAAGVAPPAGPDHHGSWLVTAALPGRSAVDRRWLADPGPAVRAVGVGLRRLHDCLPVDRCPFSWSTTDRVADAHRRTAGLDPSTWHPDHRHLAVDEALARVADPPSPEPVVCHGDACAPNTLLDDDGRWTANVDLGALGVGDRWADLAVATWSTVWNHGPGWETTLLDAYGVTPDPERIAYYRLLWDLGE